MHYHLNISASINIIPTSRHKIKHHFFRICIYGEDILAFRNRYIGKIIAITTKMEPAIPSVFMNAFGTIVAMIYEGTIVTIAETNLEYFSFFRRDK